MKRFPISKTNSSILAASSLALALCFVNITGAHAGFEWIPAKTQNAAPKGNNAAMPMPVDAEDDLLLPVPPMAVERSSVTESSSMSQPPQVMAMPAPTPQQRNAPETIKFKSIEPKNTSAGLPLPTPAPVATTYAPAPMQAAMTPPPAPVVQTTEKAISPRRRVVIPEDAPITAQMANAERIKPSTALMEQDTLVVDENIAPIRAPKPMAEPMLDENVRTNIIMSDDAPQSAREAQSKMLKINPNPLDKNINTGFTQAPEPISDNSTIVEAPSSKDIVEGFGSDIPLALALQQITPAGLAVSFGNNVNPGAKVSWTGGQPWDTVMHDMLAPLDLVGDVRGKVVFIHGSNMQQSSISPMSGEEMTEVASAESDAMFAPDNSELNENITVSSVTPSPDIVREKVKDPGFAASAQPSNTLNAMDKVATTPTPTSDKTAMNDTKVWEAEKGDSLKQTLKKWGKKGNFNVEWQASHDYTISEDILAPGDFTNAIKDMRLKDVTLENAPLVSFQAPSDNSELPTLVIAERT